MTSIMEWKVTWFSYRACAPCKARSTVKYELTSKLGISTFFFQARIFYSTLCAIIYLFYTYPPDGIVHMLILMWSKHLSVMYLLWKKYHIVSHGFPGRPMSDAQVRTDKQTGSMVFGNFFDRNIAPVEDIVNMLNYKIVVSVNNMIQLVFGNFCERNITSDEDTVIEITPVDFFLQNLTPKYPHLRGLVITGCRGLQIFISMPDSTVLIQYDI